MAATASRLRRSEASGGDHFDLVAALATRFDAPVRVANDADIQGRRCDHR